jgi:8-oxo-dGTP diphosphatase
MHEPDAYTYAYPHPAVTTDTVLLTLRDDDLQALLIRRGRPPFAGQWALPGGFLDIDEDLDRCAARELQEETGIADPYMEQFHAFGDVGRDPRERIVSVAYLALAPAASLRAQAGDDAADAQWHGLAALPELAFDHARVIAAARRHLADRLTRSTIVFRLLPQTFTLEPLRRVHELLLDAALDERNFREWVLDRHPIEAVDGPAQLGEGDTAYRLTRHVDRYRVDPQRPPVPN